VRGTEQLTLKTNKWCVANGYCPNLRRKDFLGIVHVLRGDGETVKWYKKTAKPWNLNKSSTRWSNLKKKGLMSSSSSNAESEEGSFDSSMGIPTMKTGIGKQVKLGQSMTRKEAFEPVDIAIDVKGLAQVIRPEGSALPVAPPPWRKLKHT